MLLHFLTSTACLCRTHPSLSILYCWETLDASFGVRGCWGVTFERTEVWSFQLKEPWNSTVLVIFTWKQVSLDTQVFKPFLCLTFVLTLWQKTQGAKEPVCAWSLILSLSLDDKIDGSQSHSGLCYELRSYTIILLAIALESLSAMNRDHTRSYPWL